jgi:hypothetical protein
MRQREHRVRPAPVGSCDARSERRRHKCFTLLHAHLRLIKMPADDPDVNQIARRYLRGLALLVGNSHLSQACIGAVRRRYTS